MYQHHVSVDSYTVKSIIKRYWINFFIFIPLTITLMYLPNEKQVGKISAYKWYGNQNRIQAYHIIKHVMEFAVKTEQSEAELNIVI